MRVNEGGGIHPPLTKTVCQGNKEQDYSSPHVSFVMIDDAAVAIEDEKEWCVVCCIQMSLLRGSN